MSNDNKHITTPDSSDFGIVQVKYLLTYLLTFGKKQYQMVLHED